MKNISKVAGLFGLSLLWGLCVMASINVTNWAGLNLDLSLFSNLSNKHEARVKQLFLWSSENPLIENNEIVEARMESSADNLDIYKWLVVETNVNPEFNDLNLWMIGGWGNHIVDGTINYSAIVWWSGNKIWWDKAFIGWGSSNTVHNEWGVVVWWNKNEWNDGWIVLWWKNNQANGGVILWWTWNQVGVDGLAMWQWAKWGDSSFVRNDGTYGGPAALDESALIWSKKWLLIGTYQPISGVNLVVNWAIKIWNSNKDLTWGIVSIGDCLYAYDGLKWHVFGNGSSCNAKNTSLANTCQFGRATLQEWDIVPVAYKEAYSTNCDDPTVKADFPVCGADWKLKKDWTEYKYPTCYKISDTPFYN